MSTHLHATIVSRTNVAEDLWILRLEPERHLGFIPGQYATLGVEILGRLVERPYSIVSSPYERELEVFLELVPFGKLSPHLYRLEPGDALLVRSTAKGRFTLDATSGRSHHLLLCTVTGIAPFVSYIRTLYQEWTEGRFKGNHQLFVIHGASRSWEHGYRVELEATAAQVPWLTYVPTVSRPWEDTAWKGETGRVEHLVRKYADAWSLDSHNTTAYLCGHPEMIQNGKGLLHLEGWTKDAVKEEVFFRSVLAD